MWRTGSGKGARNNLHARTVGKIQQTVESTRKFCSPPRHIWYQVHKEADMSMSRMVSRHPLAPSLDEGYLLTFHATIKPFKTAVPFGGQTT